MYDTSGNNPSSNQKAYVGNYNTMNTVISLKFYTDKGESYASNVWKKVKEIYQTYDNLATDGYDPITNTTNENASELAILNANRVLEDASLELINLLNFALEMNSYTNGYFNLFMGELNHAWKAYLTLDGMSASIPSLGEINEYLNRMNNTSLTIEGTKVILNGGVDNSFEKSLIDLGGIAKGYATNIVKEYLKSIGINDYLLNAGASSIALGEDPTNSYYNVGISYVYGYPNEPNISINEGLLKIDDYQTNVKIEDSSDFHLDYSYQGMVPSGYEDGDVILNMNDAKLYKKENGKVELVDSLVLTRIKVKNKDVCTSSPSEQHFDNGTGIVHHLISPFTGVPVGYPLNDEDYNNYVDSVTVIGDNSGKLDALSTALFVMPLAILKDFVLENNLSVILSKDGKVIYNNYEV